MVFMVMRKIHAYNNKADRPVNLGDNLTFTPGINWVEIDLDDTADDFVDLEQSYYENIYDQNFADIYQEEYTDIYRIDFTKRDIKPTFDITGQFDYTLAEDVFGLTANLIYDNHDGELAHIYSVNYVPGIIGANVTQYWNHEYFADATLVKGHF